MIVLLAIFNTGLLLQLKRLRGTITSKEHLPTVTIMLKSTTITVFEIEFGDFLFDEDLFYVLQLACSRNQDENLRFKMTLKL